jgi:hypothetical protein
MYTARLMIIVLLIVVALIAYDPAAREEGREAWVEVRPKVVAFMDGMYAVVRELIAGDSESDQIDDRPTFPEADFDWIVTMDRVFAFS